MSVSVQVWWVGVVVPLGKEPLVGVLPLFGLCCILDTQCCLVLRPCDGDKRRVCACVCVRACVHVLQIDTTMSWWVWRERCVRFAPSRADHTDRTQCQPVSIIIHEQSKQASRKKKGSRKQMGQTTQCNAQHAPGTCHGRRDSHCHKLELLINLQLL